MFSLTERRMQVVSPILEMYRERLRTHGKFDARSFEDELKAALDTGYQEIKQVANQLCKQPRYRAVAVYFMENMKTPGICSEFKTYLAREYGVDSYDYAKNRDSARDSLWDQLRNDLAETP